ncbi:MAG: dihydrodipicolinate synthase family protein [Gemmatimonadaceae bacterium]
MSARPGSSALATVLVPVATPFSPTTGDVDLAAFERNLVAHLARGVGGIVVAGSTGEAALLDEAERTRLGECARRIVPREMPLIVGVGGESTRLTVARSRRAGEMGASAVIVVAPHYYAPNMSDAALRTHYLRVADSSPIPVLLYNIPKYAHFVLAPALVADLAGHQNVCGIKDSSGDLELLQGYLASQSPTFSVLTGHGGTFGPALAHGARGGILAAALFAPSLARAVLTSAGNGGSTGLHPQQQLTVLSRDIVGALGVPGIKAAMDVVGLTGGPVRPPLLPLSPADRRRVADLVALAAQPETR